ncbi:carbonic anhydrase [Apibacter raozihei]|uniref:carbonic anhydrase n=1 Tax=Apibacter raozihei TaxID=2500547 RepID=UPI002938F0E8|nr:carbonic anhydrase family protein [Apibacter raozihei]
MKKHKLNLKKLSSILLVTLTGIMISASAVSYAKNRTINLTSLLKKNIHPIDSVTTASVDYKINYLNNTHSEIQILSDNSQFTTNNLPKSFISRVNLDDITPHQALQYLKDGNFRFVNNYKVNRNLIQQVEETQAGQNPFAVTVSCMDSRTSVEHIFDQGIGDIFSIRNAGNVINNDVLGSLEYACKVVGSKLILVLGHSHCGAIKGACKHYELGHLTGLLHKIHPAMNKVDKNILDNDNHHDDYVNKVGHENVIHSIDEILRRSPILKDLVDQGKIGITGGFYDVKTGKVEFFDEIVYNSPK